MSEKRGFRRKPLFYTVVLIIPTVIMAFLSMAVYFLPTDSTEKMTLTISVLLSIVVFLLLLTKILPPTSSTIPLMAKYLLLTFVLNVITILVTVVIVNVYFRGHHTHRMPLWVRRVFLEVLPTLICMKPPKSQTKYNEKADSATSIAGLEKYPLNFSLHHPHCPSSEELKNHHSSPSNQNHHHHQHFKDSLSARFYPMPPQAIKAIEAVEFITQNLKQKEENQVNRDDWRFVGIVLDRLMLYIFFGITLGGTIGILTSSDYIFDVVDQNAVVQKYNPNNYKDRPFS